MDTSEQLFAQLVREHKSTIYTVCYMFSKDNDEVSDLFQEILVKLWKGFGSFEGRSDIKTRKPQHLHHHRPKKETTLEKREALDGHQPL